MPAVQVFGKTPWKNKKLIVMSNFSYSLSVFGPFGELSAIFIKFNILFRKLFQFKRVSNLLFLERVNPSPYNPERRKTFENILGEGENAGNQHFLLFPKCFLSFQRNILFNFMQHLVCHLQNALNHKQSKILLLRYL